MAGGSINHHQHEARNYFLPHLLVLPVLLLLRLHRLLRSRLLVLGGRRLRSRGSAWVLSILRCSRQRQA